MAATSTPALPDSLVSNARTLLGPRRIQGVCARSSAAGSAPSATVSAGFTLQSPQVLTGVARADRYGAKTCGAT